MLVFPIILDALHSAPSDMRKQREGTEMIRGNEGSGGFWFAVQVMIYTT